MQNLDEKKSVMTEIDCNDLGFSDWENFTDDIDIASLEQSLETELGLPGKIDSYVSNAASRNIFLPYEKSPTSGAEKSFSSPDNLQPKCTARNQKLVQEYPNRKDKNIFLQKNCDSSIQNEENQKYTEIIPTVSRHKVFVIQENSVSTTGPEMIISSNVINSSQKNISNEKNTPCENIFPFKENFDSERIIFLNEENVDSQKMIISSQDCSDGQRMIISSQETSDSQRMITSSQESSSSEKMIISSQEFSDSQKIITSTQDISDSQKMITSSQDISDSQKMITSSQDISDSQKMVISSEDSLNDQRMVISCQESFNSKNLLISNPVPEDQKVIPTSLETSVRHKMFDTRSGSLPKISKRINLKTESKNYLITGSRLSLKDKKLHKLLDSKRLSGVMTTQYNDKEVSPPASIVKKCGNVKERKITRIEELEVRKKFKLV